MDDYTPIINIKVIEWLSSTSKKEHTISNVYQDDKVSVAISKITNFLNNLYNDKDVIYVWNDDTSIEFTHNQLPHVNPFQAKKSKIPIINLSFIFNSNIFTYTTVNVVRSKMFPDGIPKNAYFYTFTPSKYTANPNIPIMLSTEPAKVASVGMYKVLLVGNVGNLKKPLKYMYDNLNINNYDIAIYVYDNINRLYSVKKNWKKLGLPLDKIVDNVHVDEELVIIRSLSYESYYVLKIDLHGNINIAIYMKVKSRYSIDKVKETVSNIKDVITDVTDYKNVILHDNGITCFVFFNKSGLNMTTFLSNLTKQGDFVSNIGKGVYVYSRTSKDGNRTVDETTFLQSMINQGISTADMVKELQQYNPDKSIDEITDLVLNFRDIAPSNKKYMYEGTVLEFDYTKDSNILKMTINNIPNIRELSYLIFWISRIINLEEKTVKIDADPQVQPPPVTQNVVRIVNRNNNTQSVLELSSSSSSNSSGGAGKLQNSILTNLDPSLFDEDYARDCQRVRQPVGIKGTEHEDKLKNVDNYIQINNNTYFCPRWWCSVDETPMMNNNSKCSNGEDPINLYKDIPTQLSNPNKPKYIGFTKKNNKLCCFINKTTINNAKTTSDKNTVKYILNHMTLAPKGRYGKVPKEIHDYIIRDSKHDSCLVMLKSTVCVYREGVEDNSLISVILHILGLTKTQFINKIKKSLDFYTFVSLENGEVLKEFIKTSRDYGYDVYPPFFPSNIQFDENIKFKIFNAYIAFLDYIENNVMEPHYIYTLLAIVFNRLLYVWNYKMSITSLVCPLYTSYSQLSTNNAVKSIMVFNNEGYYEPIVLKSKTERHTSFDFSSNEDIINVASMCERVDNTINLDNIKDYMKWVHKEKKTGYEIKSVLLESNLTISCLQLKNGLFIHLVKPLSAYIIKLLIEQFKDVKMELYDKMYFTYEPSTSIKIDDDVNTILTQLGMSITNKLRFIVHANSVLFYNTDKLGDEKKTTKIFRNMAKHVIKNMDMSVQNWQDTMLKQYSGSNKHILKILLEEQKLFGDNNINRWYVYATESGNHSFLNPHVEEDSNNIWKLSHASFRNGIPDILKSSRRETVYVNSTKKTETVIEEHPFMKGLQHELPNKWKSYNMMYFKSSKYSDKLLISFIKHLIKNGDKTYEDIETKSKDIFKRVLGNKEKLKDLLSIPLYKSFFTSHFELKGNTNITILTEKVYKNRDELYQQLNSKIPVGHLTFASCSILTNISFIIIRWRATKNNHQSRNEILDLASTCDIYSSQKSSVIVVLYSDGNRYYYVNSYINNVPSLIQNIIKHGT